ncbi:uncharacterized protein LOC143359299 [Halictus rubicundus]|uniref:uncharacterized protein LOC143359299 n=1 Tax=Halictus rubicundus TaxID=77578 RepID=UPI0040362480
MICRHLGPYFIQGILTGIKYAAFLRQDLSGLLEEITLFDRERMWFQHDGCPAHYSKVARTVLNTKYPGRWIGRRGPIPWPVLSQDLTSLDFNLWGKIKCIVYKDKPTTPEEMRQRITAACASITSQEIDNAYRSFIKRLQHCINEDGQHFEHLL